MLDPRSLLPTLLGRKTRTIRVSEEVFSRLQELALEWGMGFTRPDEVLRKVLDLPPAPGISRTPKGPRLPRLR